ncbi:hypothetical protein ACFVRD_37475 [Streptomyces sp. NPDC057908]|uniref:hypothetical protein n=1 Tax=Streptomyces sp. NPDC057908 TaxID=3346276 RepID=UPI0036E03A84
MTTARGPESLRRQAEQGDLGAQLELGEWYANNGHLRQAEKCLAPLAKAGYDGALPLFTDVVVTLARTDPCYRPSAEALLRRRAETDSLHEKAILLALVREMQSWTGRAADMRELLVSLATEKGSREAALRLADMDHDDLQATVQWHCLALELGVTSWRKLEQLLHALPQDAAGAAELRERARRAVRTAQEARAAHEARAAEEARAARVPQEVRAARAARAAQEAQAPRDTNTRRVDPVAVDLGDAAVIVGAATAVPLAQTIATQAGSDIYAWVRQVFSRALGHASTELTEGTTEAALYVVGDRQTNTWLELRGRPTDEALAKLADTDLETLAAPDSQGRAVTVCWVPEAGQWQRRVQEPGGC